jgi:hypothetical protein
MKKIISFSLESLLIILLLIAPKCKAQQQQVTKYTYKVFQAPNKNFGYDILLNGKIVYHEFASMTLPENPSQTKTADLAKLRVQHPSSNTRENLALVKHEHAEKAALQAIEKMKRNELPALSRDEIKNIVAQ